jgi:hypothetical protein
MASSTETFIPFPKTPHLKGSAVVDDDESVGAAELGLAFKGASRLVVQEKVDGANVSAHFEQEWVPILQKRSGIIAQAEKQQYNVFRDYIFEHMESLFSVLSTRFCLFGEWLWNQHAVSYDDLPSYLLIFDVYDKETKEWLSRNRIEELFKDHLDEFHLVPNLATFEVGNIDNRQDMAAAVSSLLKRKSTFSTEDQEGVYVRVEDETKVVYRAKLRRATFTPGREDFNRIINNKLRS